MKTDREQGRAAMAGGELLRDLPQLHQAKLLRHLDWVQAFLQGEAFGRWNRGIPGLKAAVAILSQELGEVEARRKEELEAIKLALRGGKPRKPTEGTVKSKALVPPCYTTLLEWVTAFEDGDCDPLSDDFDYSFVDGEIRYRKASSRP